MATPLQHEQLVGRKPTRQLQPVLIKGQSSLTGLFTATSSLGAVTYLGITEARDPEPLSMRGSETVRLMAQLRRRFHEDVFQKVEEWSHIATVVRTDVETYVGRMIEFGRVLDIARSVAEHQQTYAPALIRTPEIARSIAEQQEFRSPGVVRPASIDWSVLLKEVIRMQDHYLRIAAIAHSFRQQTQQMEVRETVSPQAAEYAKSLGCYGSLIEAKKLAGECFPNLRRLTIDREEDPDEGGYPVIRFVIATPEPVGRVLELDNQLLDVFCRDIPPNHQPYFTFTYQFEA